MAIIFLGTPSFAVPSLEALISQGEHIDSAVTQPDRTGGRGHGIIAPPVKIAAQRWGIKVVQPEKMKSDVFLSYVKSCRPEFLVVVAYGKLLPKGLLEIPLNGCINVHASLLPKYRGAAPIQWAIINGEKRTGITTMLMDEGLDTGDILLQRDVTVRVDDTSGSLSERLSFVGADLLLETLHGLRDGSIKPVAQEGDPSYAPSLKKEDGLIDWTLTAEMIFNRVRALYPWPCAYSYLNGKLVKILEVDVLEGYGPSGEVMRKAKKEMFVGTPKGIISLRKIQIGGKKPMHIEAFLQGQGRNIRAGDRFGQV
jgi:methionyl-tRNA formyltransferase